ncbi:MAG: hypothetical protein SGI88_07640 [Candidatus Hydrogenedentes bacterium]|nr:hypothetical protein [Candidatus Hydrogenedentota bacterium]
MGYWGISVLSTPLWWFLIKYSIKKEISSAHVTRDRDFIDAVKKFHICRTAKITTIFFVFPIATEFHDWLMDESGFSGAAHFLVLILALFVAVAAWSIYNKSMGPSYYPERE